MTDKEKLVALLTEFGVGFEENPDGFTRLPEKTRAIIVCTEGHAKIAGFSFFYTVFEFDENGKFIQMGAWE